jgi:uncharacterized damage-inducible protein DinB
MFTQVSAFEEYWSQESKTTQSLMDALTDESLGQSVAEGHRTLARVAWHIVTTIPEMVNRTGLRATGVNPESPVPPTAEEIKKAYATVSQSLLEQVKSMWSDDTLQNEDDMYGEKWKKGYTLHILMQHEIHHRGQMSVLMRQAGLRVPQIYGPAKEDWASYGMPVPEV